MAIPQSRRLDFTEVPVIDLAPLIAGDDDLDTIEAIGRACRNIGFIYVENHGLPGDLIEALVREAAAYFARPMAEKKKHQLDQRLRGYLPLYGRSQGNDQEGKGISHQEGFWIGHERPLDPANKLDGPNLWPADSDSLRHAMEAYFSAAEGLARVLQRAFSLTLGLEADFFWRLFERPQSLLKLNHYPPQENPRDVGSIGVVPHSDSGGFTILWQDDQGGLEIQSKSGEWVGAPPLPGTFVINIGNIMQTWTAGEFASTPHRVINRSGCDRYSIPLFVNPRWDVPIGPLTAAAMTDDPVPSYETYQRASWRRNFPIAGIEV